MQLGKTMLALILLLGMAPFLSADEKPNILFIFADDQSFETIHALGNDEIETPSLDRLVRRGATFTHAYNMGSWSGAVCVASRTMINTGRFVWHARALDGRKQLEKEREAGRLWPQLLKGAGYETYMTGKWHVKIDPRTIFDHVTHVRPGMPNQTKQGYNRPIEGQPDPWSPYDPKFGGFWKGGQHWSETLRDDAVGFVEHAAKRDRPFFMYLAFNAGHDPRQSPKEFVEMYPREQIRVPENFLPEYPYADQIGCGPSLRDERLAPFPRTEYAVRTHRGEYYAIITHMDRQIGKILDALEKSGKADNTYIFFTADHGLAVGHHGLMGKQNMYDHSVRVPLMVVGPDIPQGKRIDAPVYLQDVMATTLELAGVEKPEHVEFHSLLPLVEGEAKPPYEAIYGAYLNKQRMVTQDGWKLIVYPDVPKLRLYHVAEDPRELRDLADSAASAPIIKKLAAALRKLQAETGDKLDLSAVLPK
jgi:choline-sulfatase